MPNLIKIFICYKRMLEKVENGEKIKSKNFEAGILNQALRNDSRFKPWMDAPNLPGGIKWETEIYRNLLDSDVLLALIGPGTSKSEWVLREIALATALGIEVYPLGFDFSRHEEMTLELKALDIDHLQGRLTKNITLDTEDALLKEIGDDLVKAGERTKSQQADVLKNLLARQKPSFTKAEDNQRAKSYQLKFGPNSVNLHLASGDLTEFQGIDVLVNSENDYMQMARFFESRTVSSLLRRKGARLRNGKYEDTIQQELDWHLRDRGRPVLDGEVFITSAGGPTSQLSEYNNVQYIFHVAAVQAVDSQARVIPYTEPAKIRSFTRNCLEKLQKLNQLSGIISPPDTEQWILQKERAEKGKGNSTSILFPLFGTGSGGASAKDVIEPMLMGISQFLSHPQNADLANCLTDIYISAFRQDDLDELSAILKAKFG
ncbi:MAG: TIR domain-containing protein [Bacteroidota bacterium]